MKIEIINHTEYRVPRRAIQATVRFLQKKFKLPETLSIQVVSVSNARKANQNFRHKHYVPDILTFPPNELVLCAAVIRKLSRENQITIKEQYSWLVLHGILHLLGYDHEQGGAKAKKMMDLQDRLFESLRKKI